MTRARNRVLAALVALLVLAIIVVAGLSFRYDPETSDEVIGVPPGPSEPVPAPH